MKKILFNIFRFFWTIWGGIMFFVSMIVLCPIMFLLVAIGKYEAALHIPKMVSHCTLFFCGIRLKVNGREKIDDSIPMIYIFNHHSNLDPFVSSVQTPTKAKLLAKAEILKYPGFGFALKYLHIPVKREDRRDRERVLQIMTGVIESGNSLLLYPEGTRNSGPDILKPFRRGAFKLSLETGAPIVMCTAANIHDKMRGDSVLLTPGTVHCYWDGPFYPDDYQPDQMEAYRQMIWDKMRERMLVHYPDGFFGDK